MQRFSVIAACLAVSLGLWSPACAESKDDDAPQSGRLESLHNARSHRDKTVWADESLAQRYEQTFVSLWDKLLLEGKRVGGEKLNVLAEASFEELLLPVLRPAPDLDWGIKRYTGGGKGRKPLSRSDWGTLVRRWARDGYRLVQSEWHHAAFEPGEETRSEISFALHIANEALKRRVVIDGVLGVTWEQEPAADGLYAVREVDATDIRLAMRDGEPAFVRAFSFDPTERSRKAMGTHPVILQDLDGDGLSEILLGWCNTRLNNQGGWEFEERRLFANPTEIHEVGLLADIDHDSHADFLTVSQGGDLIIYKGDASGEFKGAPIGKTREGGPLRQPSSITCGDIDADGDLDLWLSQYRISYLGGNMPHPYYDANDGFPSFLLINNGSGKFTPATEQAGLSAKQHRRTYTSCFVDLDDDADLDLLVVSDFAGVDAYVNDGKGRFRDATDSLLDESHLFGMSATFGDYNLDGAIDFYVAGMSSTTARRLERMGAGRDDRPDMQEMRMKMAFGNRMYLRHGDAYRAPRFSNQVARTGWSWGMTTFDFDNDSDCDIFVSNGHRSGKSTKDHCTHFWCHDIYDGDSEPDLALDTLFKEVHRGYFTQEESWDGYQKNVLLMNRQGAGMTNVAFLMGVADEFDGRVAVADDLDGDGRVDLLVTEDDTPRKQVLHVYRNQMPTGNNWIGVRLKYKERRSPLGAVCKVTAGGRTQIARFTVGESLYSQQANARHFGLGDNDRVELLEVFWQNGDVSRVEAPEVNEYYTF